MRPDWFLFVVEVGLIVLSVAAWLVPIRSKRFSSRSIWIFQRTLAFLLTSLLFCWSFILGVVWTFIRGFS